MCGKQVTELLRKGVERIGKKNTKEEEKRRKRETKGMISDLLKTLWFTSTESYLSVATEPGRIFPPRITCELLFFVVFLELV